MEKSSSRIGIRRDEKGVGAMADRKWGGGGMGEREGGGSGGVHGVRAAMQWNDIILICLGYRKNKFKIFEKHVKQ